MENNRIAKAGRVITAPPVLVIVFLLIFCRIRHGAFRNVQDFAVPCLGLALVPALPYVIQQGLPHFKDKGRAGQRKLAFIFSVIGYTAAWLYGIFFHAGGLLQLVLNAYFLSVIILSLCNVLHVKASGHSCSVALPCILSLALIGPAPGLVFLAVLLFSWWSSLQTRRHTLPQLLIGAAVALLAFAISFLICRLHGTVCL